MSVLKDPRCRIARHIFRVQTSDKHCCRFLATFRCLCQHLQKHSCRKRRSLAGDIVVQQLTIVYPELLQATVDDFKHSPPLLGILYTEESTVCGSSLIRSVIIWFLASSPSATRHHPGPYHDMPHQEAKLISSRSCHLTSLHLRALDRSTSARLGRRSPDGTGTVEPGLEQTTWGPALNRMS